MIPTLALVDDSRYNSGTMTEHQDQSGEPNRVINGRYAIERELGAGGMGSVFLAEDRALHRKVAIKSIRHELSQDQGFRKRIERECLLHAKVGPHPYIVTLFDKVEENKRIHLVMEYVEGETLQERLSRGLAIPWEESIMIVSQCLGALAKIHDAGIVHRDIKPANIILAWDDAGGICAKLMDFGVARLEDTSSTMTQLTTESAASPGTPLYMAPEQIDSRTFGAVSERSDVYAMAIVLYQCLTGSVPFEGTLTEVLNGHLNLIPPPVELPKGTPGPDDLDDVLAKAMKKRPEERYASAREFRAALDQTLSAPVTDSANATVVAESAGHAAPRMTDSDAPTTPASLAVPQGVRVEERTQAISTAAKRSKTHIKWIGVAAAAIVALIALAGVLLWTAGDNDAATVASDQPNPTPAASPAAAHVPTTGPESDTEGLQLTPDDAAAALDDETTPLDDTEPTPFDEAMLPGDLTDAGVSALEALQSEKAQKTQDNDSAAGPAQDDPPPADAPDTHVVQSGESLYVIAKEYEIEPVRLAKWNLLSNPNQLQVGQELYLYERPGLPDIEVSFDQPQKQEPAEPRQAESPPAPTPADTVTADANDEPEEKKGFLQKVKEKLSGGNTADTDREIKSNARPGGG